MPDYVVKSTLTLYIFFPMPVPSWDSFDNDSASSYDGLGVLDDTSSVYTASTQDGISSVDLSNLSLSEYNGEPNLPPHACRCVVISESLRL